jgi:LAS superfamily LD-carboxypeptidase LdcB
LLQTHHLLAEAFTPFAPFLTSPLCVKRLFHLKFIYLSSPNKNIMNPRFFLLIAFAAFATTAGAQTTTTTTTTTEAARPALTKEEKAKVKAQQEQDLTDALKKTGLTDAQQQAVRDALDAANKQNNDLKANTTLTEEQKAEEKKKISDAKNAKLKEIMGADGYRQYNAIRKEQKAKAAGN